MHHAPDTSWIRFKSGVYEYALPLDCVAEVTVAREARLIPFVSLDTAGVINVRGEPMPAVNGGVALCGSPTTDHSYLLVMEYGAGRVGLLVGAVARIERGLHLRAQDPLVARRDELPPRREFVRWSLLDGDLLGFVDRDGLLGCVADLLTPKPLAAQQEGENPWPNAF